MHIFNMKSVRDKNVFMESLKNILIEICNLVNMP